MNAITRFPTVRLRLTEIELCAWIGQAAPGDVLVYHRGFLALNITAQNTCLGEREKTELARMARRAFLASETGLVHLVQRRHGPEDYSYLAVARPKPRHARAALSSLLLAEVA
ncbi:hypothetical protein GCM10007972_24480 [Iodidimonas muriae]|uniref:Uncharacterized protein n=1 Tax=Iodidimonas muriae TaxID=261467 RepID=A0ABQ2LHS1_9PROT|nr:hypothetical protein [Iodidimonas muriae]GER08845.1 hypothetical protein JCM17843_31550 [Kordiimonadales bacterium JCM 17843]GGO15904.1 hypothetical protein GCM10007972_24480 [Iodidimonas muriae]